MSETPRDRYLTFLPEPDAAEILERARRTDDYYPDALAADVLRNKYLAPGEEGPLDLWERVARALAAVEEDSDYWFEEFFGILFDFKFVPGGRVMHGAGREDARRKPTLSNCYVIPITEDSLEGIYGCLAESAMVYRTGGGVGTDLSILRPKGAPVNATVAGSPGSTSFMNLLSESTNTVSQAGRRGALMLTMRVDHPDIEDFITIKNDKSRRKVQYANISCLITHEFMRAVIDDTDFDLRWNGRVFKTVRARELWRKIIENAHASAEPGIIFWDTMREYHNVEYANPLVSTNPCAEQPLAAYTACNLGSINLSKFVDADGIFDYEELAEVARTATRFLDDVIDYNMDAHALEKIKEAVASDRRIGLGITGLGDALVRMGVKYDTDQALEIVDRIMETICRAAYQTSIDLAREKGSYPLFSWDGVSQSKFIQALPDDLREQIKQFGMRNSTVLTVPPVGTGSIVAQSSSGVEPIFCTSYKRRVKQDDGESFTEYKVYHPLVQELWGDDEELPDYMVTAHDIDPYFRVRMQGVIQRWVDSSISSTVNLPNDVSVETVADIYVTAYQAGLKGITVYREGSREGILVTDRKAAKAGESPAETAGALDGVPASANGAADTNGASVGNGSAAANGNGSENGTRARRLKPRPRPAITRGVTERIRTGDGSLFITINEDEAGMCEVFASLGKAGGAAAAQSEAMCRLISLALRSGLDPRAIVDQLKGISGPNPVWDNGELILSAPDAIGRAVERYLERRGDLEPGGPDAGGGTSTRGAASADVVVRAAIRSEEFQGPGAMPARPMSSCPDCGSPVASENGCLMCKHCGWSRC
ncbi:MAG TPA: adenosylcobalamin-dependent ribonucleoside-diphosphate reductase [Gemmatimonadota bacterium]|nr:adenosylcobalamin-dependent ribonucleoside-diphosphate reductase [Gemmatimonadota bacterium]